MKIKLIFGMMIVIAVVLAVSIIMYGKSADHSVIAQQERKHAPIRVYAEWPLNGPDGVIQVITVERGSSVRVPLHIIGTPWIEQESLPVKMVLYPGSKIGAGIDTQPRLELPKGITATFEDDIVEVAKGKDTMTSVTFTAAIDAETGTWLQGIFVKLPTGQQGGTFVYLEVK
ncbi:MAG: hypothetical protein QXD90_03240 [Candidatus Nitrosocaldus sp.]